MASNLPPPPSNITLANIMEDRVDIYRQVPPHWDNITVDMGPFVIDDYITIMDNIKWVVRHLRRYRLVGMSDIQAEYFQSLLAIATCEKQTDMANW